MKIASIEQQYVTNPEDNPTDHEAIFATQVIFEAVESPCILSRLMIQALGKPGKENDMEFVHSGERCIVIWTQPQLSLKAVQNLLNSILIP